MKQRTKFFIFPYIFLSLLVGAVLAGCGEVIVDTAALNGRSYYFRESGYTCLAMGGGTISTYKDKLTFLVDDGELWVSQFGDGCNDAVDIMKFDAGLFDFSDDLSSLVYEGETYEYLPDLP
jgi:hypothetical protein